MRDRLIRALTFAVLATPTVMTVSGEAQTTAAGPYYANPAWDQTLPANVRFIVLANFNSDAVLDRETGLVWARSPATQVSFGSYSAITKVCQSLAVGNRIGWRLPTAQELLSLLDPSQPGLVQLPAGHPFGSVSNDLYWTTSPSIQTPGSVWAATLHKSLTGYVQEVPLDAPIQLSGWCVRSGTNAGPE